MTGVRFYGRGLPRVSDRQFAGKLIVIEGPDGVGRSTQIALLREWLEASGYAVSLSGLRRSELASVGIDAAKQGHTLGHTTMALYYAVDLADRLERVIVPALRAGFVVLTDRYLYSLIARNEVRGVDGAWLRSLMGFALVPDAVFFLRAEVKDLIPRVLGARGFDYWESGMDFLGYNDYHESFIEYQSRMLEAFDRLRREYHFRCVDASGSIQSVFLQLRDGIQELVEELRPQVGAPDSVPRDSSSP